MVEATEPATPEKGPGTGVYAISVVAELVGTGVQNLRLYEQRGLLEPQRTSGGTRRYSSQDVARLRRIIELLQQGLNLEGVRLVLELEADNDALRHLLQQSQPARPGPAANQRADPSSPETP